MRQSQSKDLRFGTSTYATNPRDTTPVQWTAIAVKGTGFSPYVKATKSAGL